MLAQLECRMLLSSFILRGGRHSRSFFLLLLFSLSPSVCLSPSLTPSLWPTVSGSLTCSQQCVLTTHSEAPCSPGIVLRRGLVFKESLV